MHFLDNQNIKIPKTVELILLVLIIAGLCTQNPVFSQPVQTNSNSKNIFSHTNDLKTQKVTSTNAFISTWNTSFTSSGSSNSTQIALPLVSGGTYNFMVDWGDSSSNSTITSYAQGITPHNYTSAGVYTLIITGVISGWEFNNKGDVHKIIGISQWGPLNLGNTGNYFFGASYLHITATDALNLTGTTNLDYAFTQCTTLGSSGNGNFNNWNVSQVTSMNSMFANDPAFNQPLGNWNVSQVTSMNSMFAGDQAFNQTLGTWNVSQVTSMNSMFASASVYNQSLGNWNVSHVTDMSWMFYFASAFNQPIGNWNVSSVTDMSWMFSYAYAFNQNISSWDVSHVTNMAQMFYNAKTFNQPIDKWNVSQVTAMSNMFSEDPYFNQSLGNWDVSHVTKMDNMFSWDTSFNQPIGNWNVSQVTTMYGMFSDANSFNQSIANWNVSSVKDMSYMFYSDLAFNQNISSWNVGKVTTMAWMFALSPFNYPLGNWDVSNVQSMNRMFYGDSSFNQSIGNWNVTSVTDMTNMFSYDYAFNQPLGSWNVSSVTTMTGMFTGVTLSVQNYNNLLLGWSQLKLRQYVVFDAGNSQYSPTAATARQSIITNFSWTINDGGKIFLTPPQSVNANAYNTYIFISWSLPASNGGSPISNYSIYRSTTSGTGYSLIAVVNATTLFYNDTGLTNGQTYYYIVSVNNTAGDSANSTQFYLAPTTIPSAPQSLTAQSGNRFVFLSWLAPSRNGGSAISGYKIYVSSDGGSSFNLVTSVGSSTLSYNDTGLTGGQTYYYYVSATNFAGEGADSNEVNATPYSIPSAPQSLQTQVGNSYVVLSWSAPSFTGGLTITGYNVYSSINGGNTFSLVTSVSGSTLSYNNTGLINGQIYYFEVSAINSAGMSLNSTEISATPYTVPSAPQFLQAQTGNTFISLSWSAPNSNGGSIVTGYNIYVSSDGGSSFSLVTSVSGSTLFYNDTGLTNGLTYFFKVSANNTAGMSPYSSEVSATPSVPVPNTSASATSTTSTTSSSSSSNLSTNSNNSTDTSSSNKSTTTPFLEVSILTLVLFGIYLKRKYR